MKRLSLIFCTLLLSSLIYGQQTSVENEKNESKTQLSFATENQNPQMVVVIESKSYKLESLQEQEIDPDWIESVSVFKDDLSKKLYGNKNGVVMIYPKKKYEKRILKMLEKEKKDTTAKKQ